METQQLTKNPWVKIGVLAGGVLLASLVLCDGKKGNDKPEIPKVTEVDTIRGQKRSNLRRVHAPDHEPEFDPYSVSLLQTEDGVVDLEETNLLTELERCIEGASDSICTNPRGPNSSKCITLREGGGVPVWISDPFHFARGDALTETRNLQIDVGGSEFYYPLNMSEPDITDKHLSLACKEVRRWLNTAWEDLDRTVVCKGVEPDSEDCDAYMEYMERKGSGGYEMRQKIDELQELLDDADIEFFQATPYLVDMPLLNDEDDKVGTLSIMIDERDGIIGYSIHSTLTGSDLSAPLPEDAEEAFDRIEDEIEYARSR